MRNLIKQLEQRGNLTPRQGCELLGLGLPTYYGYRNEGRALSKNVERLLYSIAELDDTQFNLMLRKFVYGPR